MKKLLLLAFISLSVCSYAQTIGLEMGANLISDRKLFHDNTLNCQPRPFTYVGVNYQIKSITTRLTYTFDLHIITIGSSIQLYNVNRKSRSYALINRNYNKH